MVAGRILARPDQSGGQLERIGGTQMMRQQKLFRRSAHVAAGLDLGPGIGQPSQQLPQEILSLRSDQAVAPQTRESGTAFDLAAPPCHQFFILRF